MVEFDPCRLTEWCGGTWHNAMPPVVRGVSIDSRAVRPGNIFVAIRGPNFDGHDFVSGAVKQGACAAIISRRDLLGQFACPLLLVEDTTAALQRMAAAYRRSISTRTIAVTGSVGKTTVKEMIADVLSVRLATARTIGNLNNEYGLPLSILNMEPRSRAGVFELGVSHPGEMKPLCDVLMPDWAVVTFIGPVHLEFFGSEEKIACEKSVLLRSLPSDGLAFVGHDGPWHDFLRSSASCSSISVGRHDNADYVWDGGKNGENMVRVLEKKTGERFEYKMPLPGEHMAYNSLFAVAVARAHGFDWSEIRGALEKFQARPMRWESKTICGVCVINDAYNANPISMAAALRTFSGMPHQGRKWLVLAGMRELGASSEKAHEELGACVTQFAWAGLVTVGPLGKIIARGAAAGGMAERNIFQCENHEEAAGVLVRKLKPGDAVLFKASRGEKIEKALEIWEKKCFIT